MNKSIRHLRASSEEWRAYDIVLPDGEIAIESTPGGSVRLKVGNGRDKFSTLPALGGDAASVSEGRIEALSSKIYRLTEPSGIELILPDTPDLDFYTEISFTTGEDAADFSVNHSVRFTGDDVAGEEFIPKTHTHYTVFVWFDGEYQGVARGLPNA